MEWRIRATCLCAFVFCICALWTNDLTSVFAAEMVNDDVFVEAPSPRNSDISLRESIVAIPFSEEAYDEEANDDVMKDESFKESDEEYVDAWVANDAAILSRRGGVLTGGIPELEALQDQIAELQKTTEELRADLEAEQKKNAKKDPKPSDPFTMKLTGHVSMDAVSISENDEAKAAFGDTKNSFTFRDTRITMKGSGHGNLEYAFGVGVNNKISLKDAYLRVKDMKYLGNITVGHFYTESGMESIQLTYDRVFASVDECSTSFYLARRIGVSSTHYGADQRSRAFFGVFAAPAVSTTPHYNWDNDPGFILNGRLTAAPILTVDEDGFTREVFHLGASHYWLCPGGENKLRLYTRGQMWTGDNPYFLDGAIPLAGRSYSVSQAEAAYQRGEFALTAEGYVCNVYDGGGTAYGTALVSRYFLTPHCSRTYVKDSGRFGSITMPEENVFLNFKERTVGQNWGALEAVAKWTWTEMNNLKYVPGATYGSVHRGVMGFNWFMNHQAFIAFNWEHAFVNAHKNNKRAKADYDTFITQLTFKF